MYFLSIDTQLRIITGSRHHTRCFVKFGNQRDMLSRHDQSAIQELWCLEVLELDRLDENDRIGLDRIAISISMEMKIS